MSFEEKNTWLYGVLVVVVPGAYFVNILARLRDTPVSEIEYVPTMLAAIGIAIGLNIVGAIAVAISSPKDFDKSDERDKTINRTGEYWAYYVLSIGIAGVLILTLVQADYFWIANAIYLAFVLSSLTSVIVRLVGYRRGF